MLTLNVFNSKVELVSNDEDELSRAKNLLNIYWTDPRDKTKFFKVYLGKGNFFPSGYLRKKPKLRNSIIKLKITPPIQFSTKI
jgi:hypothetical protein